MGIAHSRPIYSWAGQFSLYLFIYFIYIYIYTQNKSIDQVFCVLLILILLEDKQEPFIHDLKNTPPGQIHPRVKNTAPSRSKMTCVMLMRDLFDTQTRFVTNFTTSNVSKPLNMLKSLIKFTENSMLFSLTKITLSTLETIDQLLLFHLLSQNMFHLHRSDNCIFLYEDLVSRF